MAIGLILLYRRRRPTPVELDVPLKTLPLSLAGFAGTDQPVTEEEQRVAGMSDYVFRIFSRDTTALFTVYVGYYESQVTGKTIHSPRNCLPGAGGQQVESGHKNLTLDGQTSRNVHAGQWPAQAVVITGIKDAGASHGASSRKWDLLRDADKPPHEEALVRIMYR